MRLTRLVQPELLDSLPSDDPAAHRSRRDLQIINGLMGNERWIQRELSKHARPEEPLLELGAGDGRLGARMAAAGLGPLSGLDLVARPPRWPERARWFQESVFQFQAWADHPIVIGSLIFHHFDDVQLAVLGAHLNQHARLIIATEPLRAQRAAQLFALLCPLIQADAVTRHDGRVSIEAGFRGEELPHLLGLEPQRWSWQVTETWRGASRLVAVRRV